MFEKLASLNKKKPGSLSRLFTTHPQPEDRRAKSVSLTSRFPEKEEYVISTSEFNRVKARLLKTTNARATTQIDFDEGTENGKPTLKRRSPESDDAPTTTTGTSSSGTSSSSQDSGPPKLKRREGETETKPTPTPTPNN